MKFDKYLPSAPLTPYIKHYAVVEQTLESVYKVLPTTGLVIGFQFKGKLTTIQNDTINALSSAGITGISDGFKLFKNSDNIGTVLVYFTETGFTHFATHPAHELFNISISLEELFDKHTVAEVEDKLAGAANDLYVFR